MAVATSPLFGDGNIPFARQILSRQGGWVVHHFLRCANGANLTAVNPCSRAHIDDIIRRAHGILVMLHDNQGVTNIAQMAQGVQ